MTTNVTNTVIQPLNKRLILAPSESEMRGMFFIPEQYKDAATSCLVIAKGKDVSPFIKVGEVVLCEVGFGDRLNNTLQGTRHFWCQEQNIYAVFRKRQIYPFGRRVLIRRDIQDTTVGSIVIPENRRYQSLEGTIERIGLCREHFKVNGLVVGARIRLTEWKEHMTEVTLEDGAYGLIVNESDILYTHED